MKKTILLPLFLLFGVSLTTTAQVKNLDIFFDGVDDYIDIPNFSPQSFSVSFWVYPVSDDDGQNFFGAYNSDGSNKVVFGFYNGGLHLRIGNITYEAGEKFTGWAHLTFVVNRLNAGQSDVSVYKNAELVWTKLFDTVVDFDENTDLPFVIGMDWDGNTKSDFYNGYMDEFQLHSGALTQEWLQENYRRTPVFTSSSMSVYYPFQNDGTDISGNARHATFYGSRIVPNSSLGINRPDVPNIPPTQQAMVFNDGYLTIPSEATYDVDSKITVEFWMNTLASSETTADVWQGLVTKGEDSWRLQLLVSEGVVAWDTNGPDSIQLISQTPVNDGKWHHIAAVYDGVKKYLYIDGQLDNSISASGNIQNSSNLVAIGTNSAILSRVFDGALANVRIWDIPLPLSWIHSFMAKTETRDDMTLGHWQLDGSADDFTPFGHNGYINGSINYEETVVLASNEENYSQIVPTSVSLQQNYPNPFNPNTVISYQLPATGMVRLTVYDAIGRQITTLVNGVQTEGQHSVNFDASQLSSGIYLYQIEVGEFIQTKKMMLIK